MTSRSALWLLIVVSIVLIASNVNKRGLDVDELFSHSAASGHIFWAPAPCFEEAYFTSDCIREASSLKKGLESNASLDRTNGWIYVTGLYGWMKMFGYSQVAARSFSLLFYFLSAWMTWLLATVLFKDKLTSRIAVALFLTSPILLSLGWVTRSYSLAVFCGLAATYVLLKMLEDEGRFLPKAALYIALAATGIFAHYNMAFFIGMHGLLVLLTLGFNWKGLIKYAMVVGGAFVPFAVWFLPLKKYQVMMEMGSTANHWAEAVKNGTVPDVLQEGVLTEPSAYWVLINWIRSLGGYVNIDLLVLESAAGPSVSLIALLLLIIPVWLILKFAFEGSKQYPVIHFFWMAPVIWLLFATLSSVSGGQTVAFFQRYTLFFIPFMLILFANGIRRSFGQGEKNWVTIAGISLCIIASILTTIPKYVDDLPGSYSSKSNIYEEAAEAVENTTKPGDEVIFSNRKGAFMTSLFLAEGNGYRLKLAERDVQDSLQITVISSGTVTRIVDLETTAYE